MEQFLTQIFRYIPEWLFVVIIIGLGLGYFFFEKPLISVCDAQIAEFAAGQDGKLFPKVVKVLNPTTNKVYSDNILNKVKTQCIDSPKGVGCYQYFKIIQSVLYDFKKLDNQCLSEMVQKPFVIQTFEEYLSTMAVLAWGEFPPLSQAHKTGWLTPQELKTFCTVKSYYQEFYPVERWNTLIQKTLSELVEDPKVLAVKKTNKENFVEELKEEKEYKFKKSKMETQKAYDLSLFSMDCLYYQ